MAKVVDITHHTAIDLDIGVIPMVTNSINRIYLGIYTDPTNGEQKRIAVKQFIVESVEEAASIAKSVDREAAIWVRLDHPNIVPFFGKCTLKDYPHPNPPSLVYLFCPCGLLLEYVRKHPNVDKYKLVLGIAEGLKYLHQRDVVHGNLSPANIFIRDSGDAAIAHFGRAKIIGSRGHTTNSRGLTRYSSPEAWTSKSTAAFSKEADVYSFGVTALEILSGRLPFYNIIEDDIVQTQIRNQQYLKCTDYPEVTSAWWNVLEDCWRYEAHSRVTMADFVDVAASLIPSS